MSKIHFLVYILMSFGFANAQQLNCTVTVNSDKIPNANVQTFKTLEKSISDFINKTDWTGTEYKQNERINCSMFITLSTYDSNNYSATIQVQSSRPVYNSSYSSPIFNYNDNDFNFSYTEFERLNFNPSSYETNLISVLSFYSYIIIGLDQDTFAQKGGENWLEMAQEITNIAQQGGNKGWSQADGNQNRFFLISDLLSNTYTPFRQAMYEYHFDGLDLMPSDPKLSKQKIIEALGTLSELYSVRPNAFLTRVFFDAKSDEIVSVFSGGPTVTVTDLVDNLNKISPLNSAKWAEIRL